MLETYLNTHCWESCRKTGFGGNDDEGKLIDGCKQLKDVRDRDAPYCRRSVRDPRRRAKESHTMTLRRIAPPSNARLSGKGCVSGRASLFDPTCDGGSPLPRGPSP